MISFTLKNGSGKGVSAKVDENDHSLITYSSGFIIGKNSTVTVTTTSSQIIAENDNRKYLYISNQSGKDVYIKFQTKVNEPAVIGGGIKIKNDGMYEINQNNLWLGAIQAIVSAGTGPVEIFEGTSV